MMHVVTPSILLLLAAPSIASSFVAAPSLKLQQATTAGMNGRLVQRRFNASAKRYDRVFGVAPGGSSDQQSAPSSSDDNPPSAADAPPTPPMPLSDPDSTMPVTSHTVPPSPATSSASMMGPAATEPGALRRTFSNLPWHRLPNMLTYIRCLAIPALVALFYLPSGGNGCNMATGVIFGVASATDWLDGYLARRWDITSSFGAFLDPVADKLMVSTSLILLTGRFGRVVAIPSLIILAREIAVSALREWMAQKGQRDVVKVGMQGKVKTALTMVALTMLLFVPAPAAASHKFLSALYQPAMLLLYLCALVTVTSGSVYFMAAGQALLGKET